MNPELDRRLANIVRVGTIAELNAVHEGGPHATVNLGGVVTTMLPCVALRAGPDRSFWIPEPGEQVLVLSPSGDLAQGFIIGSVFSDAYPANGTAKTLHRVTYADGTVVEYNRATHVLTVDASESDGDVVVNVGAGSVTVNCDTATVNAATSVTLDTPLVTCTDQLVVQGLITGQGGMALSGGDGSTATITGNVTVTGGDVTADDIGLKAHKHGGVQAGGANTGASIP